MHPFTQTNIMLKWSCLSSSNMRGQKRLLLTHALFCPPQKVPLSLGFALHPSRAAASQVRNALALVGAFPSDCCSERTDKKTEYTKRYRQRRKHKRKDTQEHRPANIQRHEVRDMKSVTRKRAPWRSRCRQNTHAYLDIDMTSTCIN